MDINKSCMIFSMQEPYYGTVLSSMDRVVEPKLDTLGVARSGSIFKLGYNPDYIKTVEPRLMSTLLKHEVLHVAFCHFSLWGDTSMDTPEIHHLRNIAEDLEINSYLDHRCVKELKGVIPSDFGFPEQLGAREYFRRLMQKKDEHDKQQQQQKKQQSSRNGQGNDPASSKNQASKNADGDQNDQQGNDGQDSGGSGQQKQGNGFLGDKNTLDDHSMWPSKMNETEKQELESTVESIIQMAAETVQKSCSSIPGEMQVRLDKIRQRKPKPVCDWRRHLRRCLGNEYSELLKKSMKRQSRRFPDAAGNRHQRKSHILVAIDTSGSVSMPEYNEFMGQIKTISEKATFHVVECDTRIRREYDFRGTIPQELSGGGGTDFRPPIDLFKKDHKKYDALVYFTDGGAPIPSNTPKETLWVISSCGNKNANRYKVNGASVVFITGK